MLAFFYLGINKLQENKWLYCLVSVIVYVCFSFLLNSLFLASRTRRSVADVHFIIHAQYLRFVFFPLCLFCSPWLTFVFCSGSIENDKQTKMYE